jgi:hypothetical protein
MSEAFGSADSEGLEPNSITATTALEDPAGGETAGLGASSATVTDPSRPVRPDIVTPAGLNAAREMLQRAVEVASRRANLTTSVAWADALLGTATSSSATTTAGGTASVPVPGTVPQGVSVPALNNPVPSSVASVPTLGTPSYG